MHPPGMPPVVKTFGPTPPLMPATATKDAALDRDLAHLRRQIFETPDMPADAPAVTMTNEGRVLENEEGFWCQVGFRMYGFWRSASEAAGGLDLEQRRLAARLAAAEAPIPADNPTTAALCAAGRIAQAVTRIDPVLDMLRSGVLDPVAMSRMLHQARADLLTARATALQFVEGPA